MIRGAKYTLPSTLGEISAIDNMKVDVDVKELSGNVRGLVDGVLEKEDSSNSSGLVRLNLSVVNYSKDTIDINDGKIFRIRFNSGYSKQTSEANKDEVTFPCNVKFAMSEEEVIDAYGQADKVEDGKGYKVLIYQKDHGDKVVDEFKFVFNDDLDSGEYYLNDVEINMSDLAEMRANR